MKTVLLSIKPAFAEKIFNGTKKYEFRKVIFKNTDVERVVVYASSPVQKVIGEFSVAGVLSNDVDSIWDVTAPYSGVTHQYYKSYFENKEKAYAIIVGETKRYQQARDLKDYNIKCAPQSFAYLS